MASYSYGGMDIVDDRTATLDRDEKKEPPLPEQQWEKYDTSPAYDDPFGNEENAEVQYKTLTWWQCSMIMIAETVSLGILSLPSVMSTLGFAPGCVLIVGLGLLATYTGYVLGQFKARYPHVHSMADAGEVLLGWFGREAFGAAQVIFLIFVMGSHLVTFSIMMNTLTEHGACTIAFGVVGMILSLILSLPRTLKKVSYLSISSFLSILGAVFITMIAIGIQNPGDGRRVTTDVPFYSAFQSTMSIVFSYAGHVSFFGFISEMREPKDYPKTLYTLQFTDTSLYLTAAVVIYYYGGDSVTSPALGSTSPLIAKIAYGIAIPTIVIAGIIYCQVAGKYIYVRIFRGTDNMHKRTFKSIGTWVALVTTLWILAWIIASAVPVFNNLLSLIVALFASWFTFGLNGFFWLFLFWGRWFESPRKIFLTIVNFIIIGIGGCLCGVGLYVTGKAIHDSEKTGAFSCANNA